MAAVAAEPAPPSVSTTAVHAALVAALGADAGDALFQWMAVDHPTWGRSTARRLDQVRTDCLAVGTAPPG